MPILHAILRESAPRLADLGSQVSEHAASLLQRLVDKCLAKDPNQRYQGMKDVVVDVREARRALEAPSVQPKSRLSRALPVALALLLIVGASWILWQLRSPTPVPVSSTSIAVFPFYVRGSEDIAYLGEGMVNLLSTKLDGAGQLRSVDPRALMSQVAREGGGVPDPERARAIAERFGAGLFVLGDILEAGGRLHVDASLYDLNRLPEAWAQASVEGDTAQIFGLVDELTAQLLAGQIGDPGARMTTGMAELTTESLPALRAYLEGETDFRAGRFGPSVEPFQRAVAADESFALGWYRLAIAAEYDNRPRLSRDAAEQALRTSARLSDHDRLLIEAYVEGRRGNGAEAERRFRDILGAYPDDVEAWYQLAEVQFHYGPPRGRSLGLAREAFEHVLFFEPDRYEAIGHLVRIDAREGKHAELDSHLNRVFEVGPEGERNLEWLSLQAFTRDDAEAQASVTEKLRRAKDSALVLAVRSVSVYANNFSGARKLARLFTEASRSPEVRAFGQVMVAHLELARGKWGQAKAELAAVDLVHPPSALETCALFSALPFLPVPRGQRESRRDALELWDADVLHPGVGPGSLLTAHDALHPHLRTYLLGLLSAQLDDSAGAERCAVELEDMAGRPEVRPEDRGMARDFAQSVRAQVAWQAGRTADALAELEKAKMATTYELMIGSPFYSHARERYIMAELLLELGRDQEALPWYRSFEEHTLYDLIYLAPSHLRRGEIFERLGEMEKAREHYTQFIELWRDCDPELIPILEEAKGRLDRLDS